MDQDQPHPAWVSPAGFVLRAAGCFTDQGRVEGRRALIHRQDAHPNCLLLRREAQKSGADAKGQHPHRAPKACIKSIFYPSGRMLRIESNWWHKIWFLALYAGHTWCMWPDCVCLLPELKSHRSVCGQPKKEENRFFLNDNFKNTEKRVRVVFRTKLINPTQPNQSVKMLDKIKGKDKNVLVCCMSYLKVRCAISFKWQQINCKNIPLFQTGFWDFPNFPLVGKTHILFK